jgi:hypothetical protein
MMPRALTTPLLTSLMPRHTQPIQTTPSGPKNCMLRFAMRRWLGWATLAMLGLHVGMYIYLWVGQQHLLQEITTIPNLAGLLATLLGLLIGASSTSWCRRCFYTLFRAIHIFSAPLFLLLSVVHAHKTAYYIAPSVALYAADAAVRWWQWLRAPAQVSVSVVAVMGAGDQQEQKGSDVKLLTLSLGPWIKVRSCYQQCSRLQCLEPEPLRLTQYCIACAPLCLQGQVHAGDTVWLHDCQAPGGKLSGHPFSVAAVTECIGASFEGGSCRDGNSAVRDMQQLVMATVHIKVTGPWTRALANQALECQKFGSRIRLQVSVLGCGCKARWLRSELLCNSACCPCWCYAQVEGPYSHPPVLDWALSGPAAASRHLVLIAGGIGVRAFAACAGPDRLICSALGAVSRSEQPSLKNMCLGMQVTPILAVLHSLQELHDSGARVGAAPLPHVHLLFTARTRAELELLGTHLLDPTCT